jgi:beta-N-acetylhexosaminidase
MTSSAFSINLPIPKVATNWRFKVSVSQSDRSSAPLGPVILDIDGLSLDGSDREILLHPLVGGVIFFSRNYQALDQLLALVAEIRQLRPGLILSVDQEGGRVQRFKHGFTPLPAMQTFWQACRGDVDSVLAEVRDCGWLMASEILACDIDISFAPVLDVDDNHCAIIANRSFSADPHIACQLAGAFIDGMNNAGMACTGKHFPGHGGVSEDSHLDLPVDNRSLDQLRQRDLIPFHGLIAQLDAVMPAHLLLPAIDANAVGFSSKWLQQILRKDLGFKGLIFSDDLSMAGAAAMGDYGERAEAALAAGCNVVLVCNNRLGAEEVLDRLQQVGCQADNRLAAMTRRKRLSWSDLKQNPRWQLTQSQLASLSVSPR